MLYYANLEVEPGEFKGVIFREGDERGLWFVALAPGFELYKAETLTELLRARLLQERTEDYGWAREVSRGRKEAAISKG